MQINPQVDYVEMPSRDLEKTKTFFGELVGWEFTDWGPDYCDYNDGQLKGGFYRSDNVANYSQGSVLVVFQTDALEESRNRILKLGGLVSREIFSFPGGRRFHFTEPGGSEFAMWSDK